VIARKRKTTKKAAVKRRRNTKAPSAKQLAARKRFALAAKARSKKAAKKRNTTIIKKARKVVVLNPGKVVRRKVRNGYMDLVIRGTAEKTAQGWKVGKKTIPQGKGIASISSGYYLDKSTGTIFAKRARNVAAGFYDGSGAFHPIRSAEDYDPGVAGETGGKPRHTRSKKKRAAVKKASATARHKAATKARKKTTTRLATRALSRSVPLKKTRRRNSSTAIDNRKEFAGKYTGDLTLHFPQKSLTGLSTLGPLVSLQGEFGTIKPTKGGVYYCQDAKGRIHIGAKSDDDLWARVKENLGAVHRVEYRAAKPHLGYPQVITWYHDFEAPYPILKSDGQGGLLQTGGGYKIKREGIVG